MAVGGVLALALAANGCGGSTPAQPNEGLQAQKALAATDVVNAKCGTLGSGDVWKRPTRHMRRSAPPVIIEPTTMHRAHRADPGPWTSKAPLAIRMDDKPVDVAIVGAGGAKVRLVYGDLSSQFSLDKAYERVHFLPCGDSARGTWRGWPGAILSDREKICVDLAVRESSGEISLMRLPIGRTCAV